MPCNFLAAQYETDRDLVAATVAVTTAASIVTLFVWLTAMAHLPAGGLPALSRPGSAIATR